VTEPAARLYDVRYSRFTGERQGRVSSVLALARSSATRALGLRRTTGSKVWPFLLIGAAHLPAVAAIGVPLLFEEAPPPLTLLSYSAMLAIITPIVVAFAATVLPSLLTRERRDRVLSLYFSTAVSPKEYLAGKILTAVGLMSLVTVSPMLVMLIGSVLTADTPLTALREDGADLPVVVLAGLVAALYYAAIGLLAGSLTAKRVFAVGGLLAVLLVTPVLSELVSSLTDRPAVLAGNLSLIPVRAATSLLPGQAFDAEGGVGPSNALVWLVLGGVVLLSAAVLAVRYSDGDDV
jgi:ABC-2 type transport system permease protein